MTSPVAIRLLQFHRQSIFLDELHQNINLEHQLVGGLKSSFLTLRALRLLWRGYGVVGVDVEMVLGNARFGKFQVRVKARGKCDSEAQYRTSLCTNKVFVHF
jgi:hypothetical protein